MVHTTKEILWICHGTWSGVINEQPLTPERDERQISFDNFTPELITHYSDKNKGNDSQLEKLLIIEQILIVGTFRN